MTALELEQFEHHLQRLCEGGGPTPAEYDELNKLISVLHSAVANGEIDASNITRILDSHAAPFSTQTMQGLALRKPHGYAGDYEIIDKIYTEHRSPDPTLKKWDDYFHSQHAPKAVRNRKSYFHLLLDNLPSYARVLKLGIGPGRSMFEWLNKNQNAKIILECVDVDKNAITYARSLNSRFSEKIIFHHTNVFKFFPHQDQKYDLVWAAGLFDYFDDKTFKSLGARFFHHLKEGGELVIGNFSTFNPTRPYMELFGQWYLHHRDEIQLRSLGETISQGGGVRVESEPEKVNLFLHIPQA